MTKRLQPVPAEDYPAAHTLFRFAFFAAVLVVGGAALGFVGLKWLHF
jgi:hypothetical protein